MMRTMTCAGMVLAGLLLCSCEATEGPTGPVLSREDIAAFPVAVEIKFDEPDALSAWEMKDPESWKIDQKDGNKFLSLHKPGKYRPPVPAPKHIALLKNLVFKSCTIDLRMQSTSPDSPHRNLVVIFNYQNPSQFYYVELGPKAEPDAHSIFVVDGRPSFAIAEKQDPGIKWGDGWHHVRIVRIVEDGRIEVYWDDMKTPIMTAEDQRLDFGQIGVGSFEDLGNFDDIRIAGVTYRKEDFRPKLPGATTRPATAPATQPATKPAGM